MEERKNGRLGTHPSSLPTKLVFSGHNVGVKTAYAAQTLRKLWVFEPIIQILR